MDHVKRVDRSHVGPFLNYVDLIGCLFSTTDENDVILGRSYVGPILLLGFLCKDDISIYSTSLYSMVSPGVYCNIDLYNVQTHLSGTEI